MAQSLYQQIKEALLSGEVTPAELEELAAAHRGSQPQHSRDRNVLLVRIFAYIGGLIVLLGVVLFVSLFWSDLNAPARIFLTLGGGIVAYVLSVVLLLTRGVVAYLPHALMLIAAGLITFGLFVTFDIAGWGNFDEAGTLATISAIGGIFFGVSFALIRRLHVLLVTTIIFATWFLYSLIAVIGNTGAFAAIDGTLLWVLVTIVVGASYILGARGIGQWFHPAFIATLETVGALFILIAALVGEGVGWDIVYPLVLAGGFVLSVYLPNRGILGLSSLFLIIYLMVVTFQYFEIDTWWPLFLIGVGGLVIAMSYVTYRLHHYIHDRSHERNQL